MPQPPPEENIQIAASSRHSLEANYGAPQLLNHVHYLGRVVCMSSFTFFLYISNFKQWNELHHSLFCSGHNLLDTASLDNCGNPSSKAKLRTSSSRNANLNSSSLYKI